MRQLRCRDLVRMQIDRPYGDTFPKPKLISSCKILGGLIFLRRQVYFAVHQPGFERVAQSRLLSRDRQRSVSDQLSRRAIRRDKQRVGSRCVAEDSGILQGGICGEKAVVCAYRSEDGRGRSASLSIGLADGFGQPSFLKFTLSRTERPKL